MKARSARTLLAASLERLDVFGLVADCYPSTTLNLRHARTAGCCEIGIKVVVYELVAAGHITDEKGTMTVEQARALLARLNSPDLTDKECFKYRGFFQERRWVRRTMCYALADRLLRQELQTVKALRGQPEPDWDDPARQRGVTTQLADKLKSELEHKLREGRVNQ